MNSAVFGIFKGRTISKTLCFSNLSHIDFFLKVSTPTLLKTMAIKSTPVVIVLLVAFLAVSSVGARPLSAEKSEGYGSQGGVFLKSFQPNSYETGLCEYCQPPEMCKNLVKWCR